MNTDALTDFLNAMLAADVAIMVTAGDDGKLSPSMEALRRVLHHVTEAGRVTIPGGRVHPLWPDMMAIDAMSLKDAEDFERVPVEQPDEDTHL